MVPLKNRIHPVTEARKTAPGNRLLINLIPLHKRALKTIRRILRDRIRLPNLIVGRIKTLVRDLMLKMTRHRMLSRRMLSNQTLRLKNQRVRHSNLNRSNLTRSNLNHSNLTRSNLTRSNLTRSQQSLQLRQSPVHLG
jgi:hypothetical protein